MASLAQIRKREIEPPTYLRISHHVTAEIMADTNGALLLTMALDGASFETEDNTTRNAQHEQLNIALRNIASERLALWTHVVRLPDHDYPSGTFRSDFSRQLDDAYRLRTSGVRLYRNQLYRWIPSWSATG